MVAVMRQPGTNTIQVVDRVKDLLPMFKEIMLSNVHLDILYDHSQSIRDSVNDVQFTLMLTVCLVVAVIYLFLGQYFCSPSFPALPCLFRSSAHSVSCICLISASII